MTEVSGMLVARQIGIVLEKFKFVDLEYEKYIEISDYISGLSISMQREFGNAGLRRYGDGAGIPCAWYSLCTLERDEYTRRDLQH